MKPKRIHCKDVFKHICENLDQQLDSPECQLLRQHIAECPNCFAYLDGLKKTVRLFREEPDPQVPAKVHQHLFATLKLPDPKRKKK